MMHVSDWQSIERFLIVNMQYLRGFVGTQNEGLTSNKRLYSCFFDPVFESPLLLHSFFSSVTLRSEIKTPSILKSFSSAILNVSITVGIFRKWNLFRNIDNFYKTLVIMLNLKIITTSEKYYLIRCSCSIINKSMIISDVSVRIGECAVLLITGLRIFKHYRDLPLALSISQ